MMAVCCSGDNVDEVTHYGCGHVVSQVPKSGELCAASWFGLRKLCVVVA